MLKRNVALKRHSERQSRNRFGEQKISLLGECARTYFSHACKNILKFPCFIFRNFHHKLMIKLAFSKKNELTIPFFIAFNL